MKYEIEVIDQGKIEVAFKQRKAKELFSEMSEMAKSIAIDLEKPNGAKELRSVVYKVRQSKTAFDSFGKDLKEQVTKAVKSIDEDRKFFKESCDDLIDELLAPLVEIEVAEQNRVATIKANIQGIHDFLVADFSQGSKQVEQHIATLKSLIIDSSFQEFESEAKLAKFETIELLEKIKEQKIQYENEELKRQELQRQADENRAIELAKAQKDRDEQIAREATEKANREAEEKAHLEAERVEREKVEKAKKIARDKYESEQREARLVAEKEAAILREQALKQKAIDDAKQAEENKQKAIEAERQRIQAEQEIAEAKRLEKVEIDRIAEEKRIANKAHQKRICDEILQSLLSMGQSEESAKILINAIHSGRVAHVSINY